MLCKKNRTLHRDPKGNLYCKACGKTFVDGYRVELCAGCTKRETTKYDRHVAAVATRKSKSTKSMGYLNPGQEYF